MKMTVKADFVNLYKNAADRKWKNPKSSFEVWSKQQLMRGVTFVKGNATHFFHPLVFCPKRNFYIKPDVGSLRTM